MSQKFKDVFYYIGVGVAIMAYAHASFAPKSLETKVNEMHEFLLYNKRPGEKK